MRPSAASPHSNSAWITERTSKEDKLHLLEHKSTIRKLYRHNCHLASHDHQEQWKKMRTEFFKRNYDWQQHSQGQWWWILHAGLLPQDQAFLTSRHSPVPSGNAAHHQLTEFMENIVTWQIRRGTDFLLKKSNTRNESPMPSSRSRTPINTACALTAPQPTITLENHIWQRDMTGYSPKLVPTNK